MGWTRGRVPSKAGVSKRCVPTPLLRLPAVEQFLSQPDRQRLAHFVQQLGELNVVLMVILSQESSRLWRKRIRSVPLHLCNTCLCLRYYNNLLFSENIFTLIFYIIYSVKWVTFKYFWLDIGAHASGLERVVNLQPLLCVSVMTVSCLLYSSFSQGCCYSHCDCRARRHQPVLSPLINSDVSARKPQGNIKVLSIQLSLFFIIHC